MKLNCIIVDDEPLAQDVLETHISKVPSLNLVAKCANAIEANERIHNEEVDLIFLDIQMPEVTGLDFLKSLKNPPAVIFTTAYSEYALEGFNLDVIDYLLKPISFNRFMKAVNKALDHATLKQGARKIQPSVAAAAEDENTEAGDFIFVKSDKKILKVKLGDIYYIEGLKDYVMIYTDEGRIITLQTMKNLEERLPANRFLRIHRSYIISINKLQSVVGNAVEIKNKLLPIGKNYKDAFFELVQKHNLVK